MEILVGIGIIAAIWFFLRSRQLSPVAKSALQNLRELDALCESAWDQLEREIGDTNDPGAVCRAMIDGRRSDLPKKIDRLWTNLDDLSARVNQRAEHYEVVSRRPAPHEAQQVRPLEWRR